MSVGDIVNGNDGADTLSDRFFVLNDRFKDTMNSADFAEGSDEAGDRG